MTPATQPLCMPPPRGHGGALLSFITQSCHLPISSSSSLSHAWVLSTVLSYLDCQSHTARQPYIPSSCPSPPIHSQSANNAFEMHIPSSLLGCRPNLTEPRPLLTCLIVPPLGPLGGSLRSRGGTGGREGRTHAFLRELPQHLQGPSPQPGPLALTVPVAPVLVVCLGDYCAPCPPSHRCPKHPS